MTPFIEEARRMLRLAERDFETFAILRAHPDAKLAPTCFHAQQSVEKALKAVLMAKQVYFRYTHDLEELFKLLTEAGITPPMASMPCVGSAPSPWNCVTTTKSFPC